MEHCFKFSEVCTIELEVTGIIFAIFCKTKIDNENDNRIWISFFLLGCYNIISIKPTKAKI